MTLLAVAPGKFARGVEAPGTRLGGKRGTPSCGKGDPAFYDWRAAPGSNDNTAWIEPIHSIIQHDDLLRASYESDAHFVCYLLYRSGVAQLEQPRINKGGRDWVESQGYELRLETLVADVDNLVTIPGQAKPAHLPWASPAIATEKAQLVHGTLRTAAVYVTSRGLRIVQPLTTPVDVRDAEACLRLWLADLEYRLHDLGLRPDWECTDWTRVFRAPNVVREGRTFRSPAILPECQPIPAPRGFSIHRERDRRARIPIPGDVQIARSLDPAWRDIVDPIARACAGGYQGERHALGLGLAGALLAAQVPREQVPAVVAEIARGAGWDAEHHRGSAIDTIRRWSDGLPVKGSAALPELVREAVAAAVAQHRASQVAQPPAPAGVDDLAETTRKLTEAIRSAPVGLSVINAQCSLGKSFAARVVAAERAARPAPKGGGNPKTAIAVPTTKLALEVAEYLRAAGVKVLRLFGPLSVDGAGQCIYRGPAAALAEGGQSVQKLYCTDCERKNDCAATVGQEGDKDARVLLGPHALLAELDAGANGLLFIDEPPALKRDEPFMLDELVAARQQLQQGRFGDAYTKAMLPILSELIGWVETAAPEESGPINRAFKDPNGVRAATQELPEIPVLDGRSAKAARGLLGLAVSMGKASRVLRAIHRAIARPTAAATVYERGGRSFAITDIAPAVENALIGAKRDGAAKDRKVVIAGADAHLYREAYEQLIQYELKKGERYWDFAAPDGAPIERTMLMLNGSRARLATEDPGPIEVAARLVAEWALEPPPVKTCGVITFKRHESAVRRALRAAAPGVQWEVGHYGAMRGLDRWKDFDAVATLGDPRPNLDFVSRELGGGGAEVEGRYDRADAHARSELEQAHGRLRTIHRTRPGRALHVGSLLPGGWPEPNYRRPPEGRIRRPAVPGLAELVEAAGGQRAAARAVGRSAGTVGGWLTGEGRPEAAAVEALRRAGTERRLAGDAASDRKRPLKTIKGLNRSAQESDAQNEAAE